MAFRRATFQLMRRRYLSKAVMKPWRGSHLQAILGLTKAFSVPMTIHLEIRHGHQVYWKSVLLAIQCLCFHLVILWVWHIQRRRRRLSQLRMRWLMDLMMKVRDGLYYNPYFPGGVIAMPQMLIDGATEYEDGTPASESQMGKDVTTFLSWAAEPEKEERKMMGFKWIFLLSLALLQAVYHKRLKWSNLKSRKLIVGAVN